jgi:hypothetical protein
MRQSGLFRTKYNRADYLPRTVALAFEGRTEFYAGNGSVHIRKAKGKAAAADGPPVAVELPEPDPQPTPPPPSTGGEKRAEPVAGRSCREIIRDYLRDHFLPVFKRPGCFFSSRLGREVKKVEALDLITNGELLTQLALAVDAPKTKDQAGDYVADPDKLPGAVRKWAPFGYGDVMLTLPVEVEADEISDLAQEDFRRLVARGLNRLVGMGRVEDEGTRSQQTIIETRRVIEWAMEFGTRSTWQPARSYLIWARRGEGRVHIAICADLFAQVGLPQLADLGTKKFPELARRYGVVVPPQSGDEPRARGGDDKKQRRILELTEDFQAELLGPVCDGVTV